MTVGASIGMNFINKGIDQFSYGVSEEYNKYKYEKSRDDAYRREDTYYDRLFKDAERFGIHPLAMMGASPRSGPMVSFPKSMPPSGGGHPMRFNPSKGEQRIIDANARKAEAEAKIIEHEADNLGQGS